MLLVGFKFPVFSMSGLGLIDSWRHDRERFVQSDALLPTR